ncbi:MAG: aminoglycoside 6-adenylyltransferase [Anaerolineae bacterium]|nr:aminoglycoside 6-adenylyltransferase [Anaerolineae bacterium]
MDYETLEQAFAAWAGARPDVRLGAVIGSRAREDATHDAWGDLDTVIWTTTPEAYTGAAWLADLGEVWTATRQAIRPDAFEWLVVLAGGLDLDVAVIPAQAPLTVEQVLAAEMDAVLARGARVLVDRDGVWEGLPALVLQPRALPDEAAFQEAVHAFWRYAGRAAKKLRRGELWVAGRTINGLLHAQVLALIEWHTLAGNPADVWYEGHFLERWADPRVVAALADLAAPYQAAGAWEGLLHTCTLFDWLAEETAGRLGYASPAALAANMLALLRQLAAGQPPD